MATYDKGDVVRLQAEFVDGTTGEYSDPSEVTIKHKDPSANTATLTLSGGEVTKSSTGIYTVDLTLDEVGTWYWHAEGTVSPAAAGERSLEVRTTQF
tara:strand:- start:5756 stop:6046 length:291 start_codon:yes stop_codon:yes gene_type:complete